MGQRLIETFTYEGKTLAILLRAGFDQPGLNFITPDTFPMQVAQMRHPAGKIIEPHLHNPVNHTITQTQEVILVKDGRVRLDLFGPDRQPAGSVELLAGDLVILSEGGHGFAMLEESTMVEVKQGPYVGPHEKTKFDPRPQP